VVGACFNPCFPGSSAESRIDYPGGYHYRSFNPCFPGSSAESGAGPYSHRWTVSFNPCFPGSSAESFDPSSMGGADRVSILVFLDQALKDIGFFTPEGLH